MEQAVIAIIGAVIALFGYKLFTKSSADKGQKELDVKVAVIDQKVADLNQDIADIDKAAKEKVDAIDKEKQATPVGSSLSDWFNRRK